MLHPLLLASFQCSKSSELTRTSMVISVVLTRHLSILDTNPYSIRGQQYCMHCVTKRSMSSQPLTKCNAYLGLRLIQRFQVLAQRSDDALVLVGVTPENILRHSTAINACSQGAERCVLHTSSCIRDTAISKETLVHKSTTDTEMVNNLFIGAAFTINWALACTLSCQLWVFWCYTRCWR